MGKGDFGSLLDIEGTRKASPQGELWDQLCSTELYFENFSFYNTSMEISDIQVRKQTKERGTCKRHEGFFLYDLVFMNTWIREIQSLLYWRGSGIPGCLLDGRMKCSSLSYWTRLAQEIDLQLD